MNLALHTRREFLRTTALGGALSWTVPTFLAETWRALAADAADRATSVVTGRDGPILVVLQLAGGNDGLNTVVPFDDDHYRRARRQLAIPRADVLRVDDRIGFHPALKGFRALVEAGHLAVIPGVGYPNPNRSHFRSMEIWQTASDADRFEREGWLGRYFDAACAGADPTVAVNVGRQMPQAFTGRRPTGIALEAPGRGPGARGGGNSGGRDREMGTEWEGAGEGEASGASVGGLGGPSSATGKVLDFLDRTALDARASSARVRESLAQPGGPVTYPGTRLGQAFKMVAQLIAGGLPTRVYYLSQGGFDTHTNQAANHARLLGELGDAAQAFIEDLRARGQLDRVLVAAFSEFGRRVAENASGGTDHGAAGPMFLLGPRFRAPVLARYPSVAPADLFQGDLKFGVDFRSVYAGLLEHWLKVPGETVLGRRFAPFAFV